MVTWKELKDKIEADIKLMRPEVNPDFIPIGYIDIAYPGNVDDIATGFSLKGELIVGD